MALPSAVLGSTGSPHTVPVNVSVRCCDGVLLGARPRTICTGPHPSVLCLPLSDTRTPPRTMLGNRLSVAKFLPLLELITSSSWITSLSCYVSCPRGELRHQPAPPGPPTRTTRSSSPPGKP